MTSRWGDIGSENSKQKRKSKKRKLKDTDQHQQQQEEEQEQEENVNLQEIPILNLTRSAPIIHTSASISDKYERLNHIQEGSYGVVIRAKALMRKKDNIVAVKKLKHSSGSNMCGFPVTSLREIHTLKAVRHANIVRVLEVCVEDNSNVYIVMEFAEHDLKTLLTDMKNPFLLSEVKTIMIQVFSAIECLHSHSILHRDLKTSNLLMTNRGMIKVADFGLARFFMPSSSSSSSSAPMTRLVVTLWYRCPELLISSSGHYSTEIDMWSLGCIFGEILLKGSPLFPGKSEPDQIATIFALLGPPTESDWPGFTKIASKSPIKLPAKSKSSPITSSSSLRGKLQFLTSAGFALLSALLCYNPNNRLSAKDALTHPFFTLDDPPPKPPDMFPSFPSKANLEDRPSTPGAPIVSHGNLNNDDDDDDDVY